MRSFTLAAAMAAVTSAAPVNLQMLNQSVIYGDKIAGASFTTSAPLFGKDLPIVAGHSDFEITWEKKTTTTLKVTMKNTFTWGVNPSASQQTFKFDDTTGTDTEEDQIWFHNCLISVEYTAAAKKYMCFYQQMKKVTTAGSGLNPTIQVDVHQFTSKDAITAYTSIASGVVAFPTVAATSSDRLTLCTALNTNLTGNVDTSATYAGSGAVATKASDSATANYACTLDTSDISRTKTAVIIQSSVTVTSTSDKITAWETNLTNLGHESSGAVILQDSQTSSRYAYFGREKMNYIAKTAVSKSTSLGAVTTALTGHLSLTGSVLMAAAAINALAF